MNRKSTLRLDVCDYHNTPLCNLYDNQHDFPGQASNVFVKTERNGWKELSFEIPSVLTGEEGDEPNYRLDYLVADYRLRLIDDRETDWFLISEPRITHNQFSKKVEVRAGHICQLLKTKNLSLEFSDEEGNNVGTAEQLLTTILEGTDWTVGNVDDFYEEDTNEIKVRSLKCSVKTGAFKMIESMCELFDAKPIFHGDTKTVDIIPMNPFSEVKNGEIPKEVINGIRNAVELHYDRSMKSITRILNTDNIVTKLHAEGTSAGDTDVGYVNLKTCSHEKYTFELADDYLEGTEFKFQDSGDAWCYFTIDEDLTAGTVLTWSKLDPASASYVWKEEDDQVEDQDQIHGKAYHVYKTPNDYEHTVDITVEPEKVQNWFEYIMDFDYYQDVGLLSEDAFQEIAKFQTNCAEYKKDAYEASIALSEIRKQLSDIANPQTHFAKLNVTGYSSDGTSDAVVLNVDGVAYRSDYDEAEKNYFQWHVAKSLKPNGDPIPNYASVVFIIHDTNPVTWNMCYLKALGNEDGIYYDSQNEPADYKYGLTDLPEPTRVWLWGALTTGPNGGTIPRYSSTDKFYLLCTKSMLGKLGVYQASDEGIVNEKITTDGSVEHPLYYQDHRISGEPSLSVVSPSGQYGWYYSYDFESPNFGELHFCGPLDSTWHDVFISDVMPDPEEDETISLGDYFFDTKKRRLYVYLSDGWTTQKVYDWDRMERQFSVVLYRCHVRDRYYKGVYDYYYHEPQEDLPVGRYAFDSGYDFLWVFSTDRVVEAGDGNKLTLDTLYNRVYQDSSVEHIVGVTTQPKYTATYLSANEIDGINFVNGDIDNITGRDKETQNANLYRSEYVKVYPGETYHYYSAANKGAKVFFYDSNKEVRTFVSVSSGDTFVVPVQTNNNYTSDDYKPASTLIRVVTTDLHADIHIDNFENRIYLNDNSTTLCTLLPFTGHSGDLKGINYLTNLFSELADEMYEERLPALNNATEAIADREALFARNLGDLLREGFWQEDRYAEGDEDKLYKDAIENLEKIAKPEATYDIGYLDLFSSNRDMGYTIDEDNEEIEWPDISIVDAVHLIDPDIDLNIWAFFDSINKCYDQRQKTSVTINTNLSLIGQHSFTDVMTKIAEVSSEMKYKQTVYERASAITPDGKMNTDLLQGEIEANKIMINGGASNWGTTDQGHMVFYSADGLSALMITGSGIYVSNEKDAYGEWVWKTGVTGYGMNADVITTGTVRAGLIEAGSITTDKLSANIGQDLEISSNKALSLFATVDGTKPSGSVKTTDSIIEIKAGDNTADPPTNAEINVASGGKINLTGAQLNLIASEETGAEKPKINIMSDGELNIGSQGKMNIKSGGAMKVETAGAMSIEGGTLNVKTGGKFNVESGGSVVISTGSTFEVHSSNFTVDNQGNVDVTGEINAETGNIAGFTIDGYELHAANEQDQDSFVAMNADSQNEYAFWAGAEDPDDAPFSVTKTGEITANSIRSFDGSSIDLSGNTSIKLAVAPAFIGVNLLLGTREDKTGQIGNNGYIWITRNASNAGNALLHSNTSDSFTLSFHYDIGGTDSGTGKFGIYIRPVETLSNMLLNEMNFNYGQTGDYHYTFVLTNAQAAIDNFEFRIRIQGLAGTPYTISKIKLEKGTAVTAYNFSPEETNQEANAIAAAQIEIADRSIRADVTEQISDAAAGASAATEAVRTELQGKIEANTTEIGLKVSQTQYDGDKEAIDSAFTEINLNINGVDTRVQSLSDKQEKWFHTGLDGLEIGEREYNETTGEWEPGDFTTLLNNTKLAFRQKDEEVAYISNLSLLITQAAIKNMFTLGGLSGVLDGYAVNWIFDGDTQLVKRNYLEGTDTTVTIQMTSDSNEKFGSAFNIAPTGQTLLYGDTTDDFTISFDFTLSGILSTTPGFDIAFLFDETETGAGNQYPMRADDTWFTYIPNNTTNYTGKFRNTFKLTAAQAGVEYLTKMLPYIRVHDSGAAGPVPVLTIKNIKLEKNSEPTPWVKALEDT